MDLTASTMRLVDCVDACDGGDGTLEDALRVFGGPGSLPELLESVVGQEEWLEATLSRSYFHPNGFVKAVLLSGAGHQLRLHVWRPEISAAPTVENIHSHGWVFASVLLVGGYRYQEFGEGEGADGGEFHAYTYGRDRGASSYSLRPTGVRRLRCTFDASLTAGTSYTLSAEVFHRVIGDPATVTASLVLQGPHQPEVPVQVFATDRIEAGPAVPLERISKPRFVRYVRDLLAMVG